LLGVAAAAGRAAERLFFLEALSLESSGCRERARSPS